MGTIGQLTTPGPRARFASPGPPNAMPQPTSPYGENPDAYGGGRYGQPRQGGYSQGGPSPRSFSPGLPGMGRNGGYGGFRMPDGREIDGPVPMASGGDVLVKKPTMFLAGEAGPERVKVKPLARPMPPAVQRPMVPRPAAVPRPMPPQAQGLALGRQGLAPGSVRANAAREQAQMQQKQAQMQQKQMQMQQGMAASDAGVTDMERNAWAANNAGQPLDPMGAPMGLPQQMPMDRQQMDARRANEDQMRNAMRARQGMVAPNRGIAGPSLVPEQYGAMGPDGGGPWGQMIQAGGQMGSAMGQYQGPPDRGDSSWGQLADARQAQMGQAGQMMDPRRQMAMQQQRAQQQMQQQRAQQQMMQQREQMMYGQG